MPRRLHPAPRLVIGKAVVPRHCGAEMREGRFVIALPIRNLASKHLRGDRQNVDVAVIEEHARFRNAGERLLEAALLRFGHGCLSECGMGNARQTAVVAR